MTFDHELYLENYQVAKEQGARMKTLREQTFEDFKRYCDFYHKWYQKWCDKVRKKTGNIHPYTTVPDNLPNLVFSDWHLASGETIRGWIADTKFDPSYVYYEGRQNEPYDDPSFIKVPVKYFLDPEKWLDIKDALFARELDSFLADHDGKVIAANAEAEEKRREHERAEWERLNAIYGSTPSKRLAWDENHDQDAKCWACNHAYYRHWDGYEDPPAPVGCKYCSCREFKEKP